MPDQIRRDPCPDDQLLRAAQIVGTDEEAGLRSVTALLVDYDHDARLHFLRGSVLAGLQRYDEALQSLLRAVELAPDYEIARFQLGFLQLTSGDVAAAEGTWRPFQRLAADNYFRLFALGLHHLVRDEFPQAIEYLREGIERNADNQVLNNNMMLLIDELSAKMKDGTPAEELITSTHFLLQNYKTPTTH